MHPVAAVGDALEVAGLADDRHSGRQKANGNRCIPSGNELAKATPAKARRNGFSIGLVTDSAAKANPNATPDDCKSITLSGNLGCSRQSSDRMKG